MTVALCMAIHPPEEANVTRMTNVLAAVAPGVWVKCFPAKKACAIEGLNGTKKLSPTFQSFNCKSDYVCLEKFTIETRKIYK